ncbi:MAG: 50S ribosomal protein L3 [Candidatus Shapirobacteria bacterium]|jgi:large subunit ribosomal protein L3
MISGFPVKKGQMTSIYTPTGQRIAVTKCIAKPIKVTQIKTIEKDGYQSVQIAFDSKKHIDKATSSKIAKLKLDIKPRFFQEFKLTSDQIPEVGNDITIESVFNDGDLVDIVGVSKGHGFAGVVKRHGFRKQPLLGSSNRVRHPGSIGAQTPGKVVKGKKMPGHFGVETTTVSGLQIFSINHETNEVLIKGSVPGSFNSWITIKKIS